MSNNLVKPPDGRILTETACRHCEKKFYGPSTAQRIGMEPGHHFIKYLSEISGHIAKKHGNLFDQACQRGAELQGMLILSNFDSSDPEVIDQRNYYRWKVHQATLQAKVPNEAIARKADECIREAYLGHEPPPLLRAALKGAIESKLRELRDILQEPDAYTDDGQPKSAGGSTGGPGNGKSEGPSGL